MGGKNKQAQRTKNNTRPSSSGRSAELLGSSLPQFTGFSAIKESVLASSGFTLATDDIETIVDINFQLVFKKMNKKDSTTKLKALQEFTELAKAAEVEIIKAILPFWPRLYCALAIDTEHKVREAAQAAHHQLVVKAKRNLAPYLKQIIGTWFISQYDTYAPAASAAIKSFQDSFPHNKAQEAIIFCQEEILAYICDNLTIQTPEALSTTKPTSSQDSEAKYQRVIVSSLNSYALYLSTMPSDKTEKCYELNVKIVTNAKFWKLGKNKVPSIRSAWFTVLTNICQKLPTLMEKESSHIVGAVFSNLDENEPTVLPAVWETALAVLSLMKEWWKYVNVDKLVLPKLYKILKDGGNGNAAVIFPNLLPVISHLPDVINFNVFYPEFFESLQMGLKAISVFGSRSESQAISVAFIECLQYIIMKNQSDISLCEKLIKTQLFPLLEWTFNDRNASYKNVYNQVAKLIQFWDRNFNDYEKCLFYFWHNIESLYLGLLLNLTYDGEVGAAQLATRQIELVSSLKHLFKSKKNLKVCFDPNQCHTIEEIVGTFSDSYCSSLSRLVYKTSEAYVKITNEKQSPELIEYIVCLIQNVDLDSFFKQFNVEKGSQFCGIYSKLLLKWLSDEIFCSKPVVDLIFLLFKHFSDEEKLEVLQGFFKESHEECLVWCLTYTLSHLYYDDPVVIQWLGSETVNQFFISIAERTIANNITTEQDLILKRLFSEKPDGGLVIEKNVAHIIIKILIRPLLDPLSYPAAVDDCVRFVSYISTVIYTSHLKLSYGLDLLEAMFALSNSIMSEDILSIDTCWEVNTAWEDVITLLAQEHIVSDLLVAAEKCVAVIIKTHTEKSVELIYNFLKIIRRTYPSWLEHALNVFFKHDFINNWQNDIGVICEYAEYINGAIFVNHTNISGTINIDEDNIENYFEWMNLLLSVFVKLLEHEHPETISDFQNFLDTKCSAYILNVFITGNLGTLIIQHYPCLKSSLSIKKLVAVFQGKVFTFCKLYPNHKTILDSSLTDKLAKHGLVWSYAIQDSNAVTKMSCITSPYYLLLCRNVITQRKKLLLQLSQKWAEHIRIDSAVNYESIMEAIILLRCEICKPDLDHTRIIRVLELVEEVKQTNPDSFVYNNNLQWGQNELIIEVIHLFSGILRCHSECVKIHHWDFIITNFVTWCESTTKSLNVEAQTKSIIFALSDLFASITKYVEKCNNGNIVNEWKDIFVQDVYSYFLEIWCYFVDHHLTNSNHYCITDLPFLQGFGKMISNLDISYIFSKHCSVKWLKLLSQSYSLLTHSLTILQLWGYHMIIILIPGLVEIDATAVNTNTPHQNGLVIEQCKTTLIHIQEVIQSMLSEFKLGEDNCRVQPFTDSYTYTFGYILVWDTILSLCEQSSPELRFQYSDWLKKEDFVSHLLVNLFKLIPLELEAVSPFLKWFTNKCSFEFTEIPTSQLIEREVCWIYSYVVTQLPVLVRQWWCNQESRVGQIVEQFTSTFVSTHLCNQELTAVMKHQHKFKNMTIKTYPVIREVVAIYTVDEVQMELIITLPQNYPLVGPDVQCDKQILGTSQRQWLMQLKLCVLHQDGRVWDGLMLWNNNLDKRFDGVEECYICFAVIHQGTYQIPRLSCQTCKKKFHSACLYKWFSTSNKSSCPVCRNLF